jgi:hypothetical protein
LLQFGSFFTLELSNLLNDGLEDLVGRHVIELSESCVYSLRVVESHVLSLVALEDTLWLATEYYLLYPLDVLPL